MSLPPYQYVVLHESVRDHPGVIAVHAAHAAAESCFDGPAPSDTRVVVLVAPDSEALRTCAATLDRHNIRHALIVETDGLRAGQATALGVEPVWAAARDQVRDVLKAFKVLR